MFITGLSINVVFKTCVLWDEPLVDLNNYIGKIHDFRNLAEHISRLSLTYNFAGFFLGGVWIFFLFFFFFLAGLPCLDCPQVTSACVCHIIVLNVSLYLELSIHSYRMWFCKIYVYIVLCPFLELFTHTETSPSLGEVPQTLHSKKHDTQGHRSEGPLSCRGTFGFYKGIQKVFNCRL